MDEIFASLLEAGVAEEKARAAARSIWRQEYSDYSRINKNLDRLFWLSGLSFGLTVVIAFVLLSTLWL